jgi:TPR repeat protein
MLMNGEGIEPNPSHAVVWFRRALAQGNRQAIVNFTEYDLSPLFTDEPRLVKVLQNGLRNAGVTQTPQSGQLDEPTLASLAAMKRNANIEAKGITLQVMDRLGIVAEVFSGASR